MNGNFNNNYGFGYQPGMIPNPNQQQMVPKSWLSNQEIEKLRKHGDVFNLAISEEDKLRAQCNHRDANGNSTLVESPDGGYTCAICGHKFNINSELTPMQVEQSCRTITDILQTCKLLYMSLPEDLGKQFFQILAFIDKIPKLYETSCNDFKRYDNVNGLIQGAPLTAFSIFGSMVNPSFGFGQYMGPQNGAPQQQYMNTPQQPIYGQQPMMGGYQQPMNANPFYNGYQQPGFNNVQQPGFNTMQQPGFNNMQQPNPTQQFGQPIPNPSQVQPNVVPNSTSTSTPKPATEQTK